MCIIIGLMVEWFTRVQSLHQRSLMVIRIPTSPLFISFHFGHVRLPSTAFLPFLFSVLLLLVFRRHLGSDNMAYTIPNPPMATYHPTVARTACVCNVHIKVQRFFTTSSSSLLFFLFSRSSFVFMRVFLFPMMP